MSKQTFGYDDAAGFNNQNNVKEYDFGAGTAGSLVRETRTTFETSASYTGTSVYLRSLPTQISVYDGNGVERARTTTAYDNYTTEGLKDWATDTGIAMSGHDASFGASYTTRGNATSTTSYLLTNGVVTSSTTAYAKYDFAGNVVKTTDARGYATNVEFKDRFGVADTEAQGNTPSAELGSQGSFAFPTKVTNAAGHVAFTQFDFYTGKPVNSEDANGIVSSAYYNDFLDRPTRVVRALNTGSQAQTSYVYDDAARKITTTSDQTTYSDNVLKSETHYDQMGRTIESRQYEGANYIAVQTQYDALGRAFKVSNPFRPLSPDNETPVWTTTGFDVLNRVTTVTTPDSAVVNTYYSGNQVLVRDAAGKERMSQTDALGQLSDVWEITAADSATESITFPNRSEVIAGYRTKYAYDTLGNLITVTQRQGTAGTLQTRTFVYDSLKRLSSATNPESGTVSYTYDNNSNLLTKTDARNVVTTYVYDALNRNTSRTYSDGTPAATYTYDSAGIANGKGRLAAVSSSVSTYTYGGYDAMGQVLSATQTIGAQNYPMSQTYDLAGHVKQMTYPSNRTVNYSYDTTGRLNSFTGNLGDSTTRNYATSIIYASNGAWKREQFGTTTTLYNKRFYNNRQQLHGMFLSTVTDDGNWNRGAIVNYYSLSNYGYGLTGTDTNGNLYVQQHWVPADDAVSSYTFMQQNYDYDALNRLRWMAEYPNGGASSGSQDYGYDRWGNRTISSAWGTGINGKQFSVTATNNRLGVPSGQSGTMSYDAAGNLTTDTYSAAAITRAYDGENRMLSETQSGGVAGSYAYNADGQRVKRTVGSTTTWQVYSIGGELLAEYAANAAASTPQREYGYRNGEILITAESSAQIKWLVTDHLGTSRMIADLSGSLAGIRRPDYLPFGEGLYAGTGNRSTGGGYSGDNVRQKFTSKERDNETGLDYSMARYYGSSQGRFISPDPLLSSGIPDAPQSWNRYSYTINNPLKYIDPSGLIWVYQDTPGSRKFRWYDNPKDVPSGWTEFTDPYFDGADGRYYFNPKGPAGWFDINGGYLMTNLDPYTRNGWAKGPTPEQYAAYMRSGAVEDASWDLVGLMIPGRIGVKGAAGALTAKAAREALEAIPKASNRRLQNSIDQLFRPTDRLPGGTAGAIRHELRTGELVGGRSHLIKGPERIRNLQRIMREERLSPADRGTAERLIHDLQNALKGK